MRRVVYRAAALRDLANIATYIAKESGSLATAETFIKKLTAHCEHIASLPVLIGRPRPELRTGYRSITYGNYVIFLRYEDVADKAAGVIIGNIIHGRRDLDAYFAGRPDDSD